MADHTAYMRAYRAANYEKVRQYERDYYAANSEKIALRRRVRYATEPEYREKVKAQVRIRNATSEAKARRRAYLDRPEVRARNRELANRPEAKARKREQRKLTQKATHLRGRYGMSLHEWDQMLVAQDHKCAVCRRPMERIDVDHDHQTGGVRGLVCHACNMLLGLSGDDPARLLAAADYLRR